MLFVAIFSIKQYASGYVTVRVSCVFIFSLLLKRIFLYSFYETVQLAHYVRTLHVCCELDSQ